MLSCAAECFLCPGTGTGGRKPSIITAQADCARDDVHTTVVYLQDYSDVSPCSSSASESAPDLPTSINDAQGEPQRKATALRLPEALRSAAQRDNKSVLCSLQAAQRNTLQASAFSDDVVVDAAPLPQAMRLRLQAMRAACERLLGSAFPPAYAHCKVRSVLIAA
jgi:hypothetical protein